MNNRNKELGEACVALGLAFSEFITSACDALQDWAEGVAKILESSPEETKEEWNPEVQKFVREFGGKNEE